MQLSDLDFIYPNELVSTQPTKTYRTLLSKGHCLSEISHQDVLELFNPGDVLVVNDTQVLKRRIFSASGVEVLFLKQLSLTQWQVLFAARGTAIGESLALPGDVTMQLIKKGLPQTVELSKQISEEYFDHQGELALPPYIQKAREQRHNVLDDNLWYQTQWAKNKGSFAAPTASLHFTNDDLTLLQQKGVKVVMVTLHVGLGTFLPIKSENLNEHVMHSEWCEISNQTQAIILQAKKHNKRIFALGTTVTRTLESWFHGFLSKNQEEQFLGETDIFIKPGFEFKCIDVLMTNFHQPKSTLLALVAAFAGLEHVKQAYSYAIEKRFKLFSYGDFSIWMKGA